MAYISRRDFLNLTSLISISALSGCLGKFDKVLTDRPNIIIILFDAMSANHMSLYGYPRETTPQISNFASRASVYHSHYSAGNFTTTGTASMLTGMFPWKHRAFNQGGLIQPDLVLNNPYSLLGDAYYRLLYSQNIWPDHLVGQFYEDVDRFLPLTSFSRRGNNLVYDKFGKDRSLAAITFEEFLFTLTASHVGSSLLGYLYKSLALYVIVNNQTHPDYPKGVPENESFAPYLNEEVYEGLFEELIALEARNVPYFAYAHLYSPHSPYKPGEKFSKLFKDDFLPPEKPVHPLLPSTLDYRDVLQKRRSYDQQIAHVDAEFGKLIDRLESEGVLENSYVIATSDHGEMFERGFAGHGSLMMYEPVLKIPLLIHAPGQKERQDYYSLTSNVDILPTLLNISDNEIPDILDGKKLPGYGGIENSERPVFALDAVENSAFQPINKAVISMHKSNYKLIAYFGYPSYDHAYEFYNLENDPEEMINLADSNSADFVRTKEELLDNLADANRPHEPK